MDKFKVKRSTIHTALARGTENNIGVGTGNHNRQVPPVEKQPFEFGPFKFDSKLAASKYLRINYRTFLALIRGRALERNRERLTAMFMEVKSKSEREVIRSRAFD